MNLEWDFDELLEFADRLSSFSSFEKHMKQAAKDISKALLKRMKSLTPVDEYDLINGWIGNNFLVTEYKDGYEVSIVNKTPYALAVNDGHKSFNQYGGPYEIKPYNPRGAFGKPEGRIQVRSPYKWQAEVSSWYVFGHFFVERGIIQLKDTKEVEGIILKQLDKWWEECING